MKQLKKKDLIRGEIYKQLFSDSYDYIFLFDPNYNFEGKAITQNSYHRGWYGNGFKKSMIETTPEEKHWLNTCIEADKFISYEEAMKSFIPEYVECIIVDSLIEVGKVYKTTGLKDWDVPYNDGCNKVYTLEIGNDNPYYTSQFKPSTKEAYDAQFVVKEPEFVLPELWCIQITNKNCSELKNKLPKIAAGFLIGQYIYYCNYNKNNFHDYKNWSWNLNQTKQLSFQYHNITRDFVFPEITFNQFKQYVLKENTTVTEKPKVVLEEPKDKVLKLNTLKQIVQVECSEGGVYQLGDKIKVFDKYSPNKGKPFTIKSFRWTNDKSKICAVTELHTPNGIGLDKIELYVEPKKELSLLEQAKLKYPIGTKFKVVHLPNMILTVKNHEDYYFQTNEIVNLNVKENINGCTGGSVYYKGQWAEIVEDFVLPEKWCVKITENNMDILSNWRIKLPKAAGYRITKFSINTFITNNYNNWDGFITNLIPNYYTEITFEQFKKHVLNEEL